MEVNGDKLAVLDWKETWTARTSTQRFKHSLIAAYACGQPLTCRFTMDRKIMVFHPDVGDGRLEKKSSINCE